jgi:hypothetical protein
VAARTALDTKNLETLGAKRLAELLIEISVRGAPAKRRLRLELASATGTGELGK